MENEPELPPHFADLQEEDKESSFRDKTVFKRLSETFVILPGDLTLRPITNLKPDIKLSDLARLW